MGRSYRNYPRDKVVSPKPKVQALLMTTGSDPLSGTRGAQLQYWSHFLVDLGVFNVGALAVSWVAVP